MDSKVNRCKSRLKDGETITDKELIKNIKMTDKKRKSFYEFYTGKKWGDKSSYDLMINTSNANIKQMAKNIADLIRDIYKDN